MSLEHIQQLTEAYADHYRFLNGLIRKMQEVIDDHKRSHMPAIINTVEKATEAKMALYEAIKQHPELFNKPKTQTFSGIKVGITKQKGKVTFDDEAKVIDRIEKKLPEDQAELLIRVSKNVQKQAVYDLLAADLKRLGISISDDENSVVIKPTDGDIDKIVSALLNESEALREQA